MNLRFVETAAIPELERLAREEAQRKFLTSRGKRQTWTEAERRALRSFTFNSLDVDSQGFVSLEAVERLLLSLGLVDNRETLLRVAERAGVGFPLALDFEEFVAVLSPLLSEGAKALLIGESCGLSLTTAALAARRALLLAGLLRGEERGLRVVRAVQLELLRGGMGLEARDRLTRAKVKSRFN